MDCKDVQIAEIAHGLIYWNELQYNDQAELVFKYSSDIQP